MTEQPVRPDQFSFIEVEVADGVGWLRLNRPEVLNAFHLPMYEEIVAALASLEGDESVRAILITGNGRAFCAGRDFRYSSQLQEEGGDPSSWRRRYRTFFPYTAMFTTPIISAVQGYALGGGASLALGADITIATPEAKFGYPETRHGIASKSMLWAWHLGPKVAKEVVATGRLIAAGEASRLRLVSMLAADDELIDQARSVAADVAGMPEGVTKSVKRMANWASRDMARVVWHDRMFDVETAAWDAAGVEPSPWLVEIRQAAARLVTSPPGGQEGVSA